MRVPGLGQLTDSVSTALGVLPRVNDLLDTLERLLARLDKVISDIDARQRRADTVIETIAVAADALPSVLERLDREVIPVLGTLNSVAPDLTELLTVSRALNEILGSVPGLKRAKERAEDQP